MRVALLIVLGLVALAGVIALVGSALPRGHRASSRVTLKAPPAAVWAVVRDPGALLGTWTELKSSRRLPDRNGKEVWEQNAGGFPVRLIVEEAVPPSRLVTRIDAEPGAAFGGTWTYELAPEQSGTRLTVTEDGYVSNPVFRVLMRVMGTHRTADGYLRALGTKLSESVSPEHVK